MKKILFVILSLIMLFLLLSGCNMRTVEELYSPPKRPDAYNNLQTQIDKVMPGHEYSAPLSGENRQAVQAADLDGDGISEYLLFTKSSSDMPLQIHIFAENGDDYVLLDSIESTGASFELVEYLQIDGYGGVEIVVGRQVSDQVLRSVSVYTLHNGQIEQYMVANYHKFVCCDLDQNGLGDLLVLRPGESESDNGVSELYRFSSGIMERSQEVNMSKPAGSIKRIMISKLYDGLPAVYVASDVDGNAIITDVYASVDGQFTNVSFSNESGTSVQTLRNYYVYADDIDSDGVLELPDLINMKRPAGADPEQWQYSIRWYAMDSKGGEIEKIYTYHNFAGGWYVKLRQDLASRIYVQQKGNGFNFYLWDEQFQKIEQFATIYILTGQNREEQATTDNRFVLHRTESTVYAASLDVSAANYGVSSNELINSFHLIQQDWFTGET